MKTIWRISALHTCGASLPKKLFFEKKVEAVTALWKWAHSRKDVTLDKNVGSIKVFGKHAEFVRANVGSMKVKFFIEPIDCGWDDVFAQQIDEIGANDE